MTNDNDADVFVIAITDLDVEVHAKDADVRRTLLAVGFTAESSVTLKMRSPDVEAKIKVLCLLRDMGFAFSAGPGWSPSEVFEDLRDRKLLSGTYKRISWTAPGKWRIEANC